MAERWRCCAAGSQPLSLVFLPLAALRLVAVRDWREHAVVAGLVLGVGCQVWSLASYAQPASDFQHAGPTLLGRLYSLRVGTGSFGGLTVTQWLWRGGGVTATVAITVLLILLVVVASVRNHRWIVVGYALAASATLFAAYVHTRYLPVFLTSSNPLSEASRYSVPSILLLLSAVVIAADPWLRRLRSKWRLVLLTFVAACVAAMWSPGFHDLSNRGEGPRWLAGVQTADRWCEHRQQVVAIPISPPTWAITVKCSSVDDGTARSPPTPRRPSEGLRTPA